MEPRYKVLGPGGFFEYDELPAGLQYKLVNGKEAPKIGPGLVFCLDLLYKHQPLWDLFERIRDKLISPMLLSHQYPDQDYVAMHWIVADRNIRRGSPIVSFRRSEYHIAACLWGLWRGMAPTKGMRNFGRECQQSCCVNPHHYRLPMEQPPLPRYDHNHVIERYIAAHKTKAEMDALLTDEERQAIQSFGKPPAPTFLERKISEAERAKGFENRKAEPDNKWTLERWIALPAKHKEMIRQQSQETYDKWEQLRLQSLAEDLPPPTLGK